MMLCRATRRTLEVVENQPARMLTNISGEPVLIDPQYGNQLVKDSYYEKVVTAVADVAKEMGVLLVDRFETMRELQRERGDGFYLSSDNLHMNDIGHRCMAEQLARSIVAGLLQADAEGEQPLFYP